MRALLLLGLSAVAAAAPGLPARVPLRTAAERASRADEFRRRNTQAWKLVEVDKHGFISHLITYDPELTPASSKFTRDDVQRILRFLRANADLFGVDVADIDQIKPDQLGFSDAIGGTLLGEITIQYSTFTGDPRPHLELLLYFHVTAKPTLTEAELVKRVAGATYHDTIGYAGPSQIDCAMTPAGPAGCVTPVEHTRERDVTLTRAELRSASWLVADGDTMRYVGCVDASMLGGPPADKAWGNVGPRDHALVPRAGAPKLPLVVDLVTGDTVATTVHDCFDSSFASPR
ncbi:MAG TPA: hypothetical protein VGI70_12250 [Polyangiales bacterium]|jgi:hypothetical protein